MKRFIALMAVVGLCTTFSMGCKKMMPGATPEETPEAAAVTTPPPPPPPPPAAPATPAEPEKKAE